MTSRPQVGIERLPARRMSNEPRESMNCKSCRKRKIKCNRLRPTCEACQVFQCPCVYGRLYDSSFGFGTNIATDAVPKKRGPKTDVLEALLRRVDGLEKRLKDEKKSNSPHNENGLGPDKDISLTDSKPERPQLDTTNVADETAVYSPAPSSATSPVVQTDSLLNTYFARCHGKSYYILDETNTRQRVQHNQIPSYLLSAIYAVSARYTPHPNGYHAAVRLSEDYAIRARSELDIDDPSIDCLQTLLLLTMAFTAAGKGKKAYMMLASGIGMALALELHRELDTKSSLTPVEKEMRRRLFWTCYLMDRFTACGSKRPSLIADRSVVLKLPSWSPNPSSLAVEGEFFQIGSNLQYHGASGKKCQGSSGMLIDIVRILGITNRYLAAGGVKGDSHFPWHSLSNLSKIRQDLDVWASGTQDVFSSVDTLFGQPDSTTLVLSKLVYHLIHCLIYRPFLPIDLAELAGTGQHQSWQIEATNLCFLHANAIAELVELGKQSPSMEWPAFVGYCICTAGTVHVHGTHYRGSRDGEVFSASAEFLSREMQQLSELRYAWSSVQHQRETLQTIYGCHSELVKSLASNPMRYSPVFHLEDFFDRYSDLGQFVDGAHISFADILVDPTQEPYTGHDLYVPRPGRPSETPGPATNRKRKASSASRRKHIDLKIAHRNSHPENSLISPDSTIREHTALDPPPLTPFSHTTSIPNLSQTPFSPPYTFNSLNPPENYDPMFGMPQMGFGYGNGMGTAAQAIGEGMTPGGRSNGEHSSNGGASGDEKDPFLSLLEQLAENEHSRGGPSELDFFLSGGNN
ncbi:putative transcriptional regulatory protein [Lachnellula subtilissima]|uniref:Putative transcriptional regulatory protein n=1 Tax=Lachnellula subtilissima TaxID=602034 RepID=A0A8H8RHR9_9HELO|nr:putative transcriptional regulatory protein [Lachnellula subtilissima]